VRLSSGSLSEVPSIRIMDGPSVIAAAARTAGPARPRCRGLLPLSRWGDDSASLRAFVLLALLGFLLPGAFPFPALACSVVALTVRPSASASRQPRDRCLDGAVAEASGLRQATVILADRWIRSLSVSSPRCRFPFRVSVLRWI
jgi:hypothetical protein